MANKTDWQGLLQELSAQTDPVILRQKAEELETAIFLRSTELNGSSDAAEERNALNEASYTLLRTRVEKLGFPLDAKFLSRTGAVQPEK